MKVGVVNVVVTIDAGTRSDDGNGSVSSAVSLPAGDKWCDIWLTDVGVLVVAFEQSNLIYEMIVLQWLNASAQ